MERPPTPSIEGLLVVKASNIPISFVFVGIGELDFTWLAHLNAEVAQVAHLVNRATPDTYMERKMVHFARFEDHRSKTAKSVGAGGDHMANRIV